MSSSTVSKHELRRSSSKEAPCYKKKQKLSSPSPCGFSSLPDELALTCIARASISDHASLSLVSKWHRSQLLPLDNLYNIRSSMGVTENCPYLCLRIGQDSTPRWYTLSRRTHNLVPITSSEFDLSQPPEKSSVVALGYGIYIMGGKIDGRLSSRVFFLDCRTHTWTSLASMKVARASAAASVVDGKIYVFGGCKDTDSWGEVFDPKTQTWDVLLPMSPKEKSLRIPIMDESVMMNEKIFALNRLGIGLVYIPSEKIWKRGSLNNCSGRKGWNVIDNVLYCCVNEGRVMWCEAKELEKGEAEGMEWSEVMGLEELKDALWSSKLVNYGEELRNYMGFSENSVYYSFPGHKISSFGSNMLLFWDVLSARKLEIWCAEISLERCTKRGEIWGNIEWSEPVMTLNPRHNQHCKILHSLSVNL